LKALLGPGFQVEPPSSRGRQFEATSRIYAVASNITSVFALFIGMFIIYNTFAIAVTQRRSEIGILRALGATRGQIRTLFLVESALTGLAGTMLGIVAGLALARAMAGYIGGFLEDIYGVAQRAGDIGLDPKLAAAAVGMGVLTSLVAAVLPARSAARVDPVKALQKGKYQLLSEGESRARRNWAAACAWRVPGRAGVQPNRNRTLCRISVRRDGRGCCCRRRRRCGWRVRCGRCSSESGRWRERSRPTA